MFKESHNVLYIDKNFSFSCKHRDTWHELNHKILKLYNKVWRYDEAYMDEIKNLTH